MKRRGAALALTATFTCSSLFAAPASAETRHYAIAIGNNRPPVAADSALSELQYADDDAADFTQLAQSLGAQTALLAVLDHESQLRFPALARASRPPTLAELRRTVARVRAQIEADAARGDDAEVLLFFSGHGVRDAGQPAALALLDGALTQRVLYEEVLAALPARLIHLLVDACHAEAVVRPRDLSAEVVQLDSEDLATIAANNNLARFPHVGAIVAAESAAQAHEWEVYQRGVFTHEVLSGLRGAADVNGDRRIEYSELSAFLMAANREIANPRARPSIVVRVPELDRRAPIVDLARARHTGRLVGVGDAGYKLDVEDGLGNRLVDLFTEPAHRFDLTLPADVDLHLRVEDRETSFRIAPGAALTFEELELHKTPARARGALESSLHAGLFATPFGPLYYRGFVDAHPELVPVSQTALVATRDAPTDEVARPGTRWAPWLVTSLGIASAIAAGVSLGIALDARHDFRATELERDASQAAARYATARNTAIGLSAAAAVGIGVGSWLLKRARKADK